ncbi:MAG TPA: response regulator [Stellaceae bacterium]|jgi:DNA-binding response OmpR family regulator|nr:response regulator [Stellaceae bacterium]
MSAAAAILIVDDDRDLAESLADVLEARGYAVELAGSGEEAVERFRCRDFDVVFTDVKLPGMNGVESLFAFRQIKPDAKVVMMTGFSVEQLLTRAVENGALAVLHKPFAITDLLAVLERIKPTGVVVLADDDDDFVDSIEPLLRGAGYRVLVARDGGDAVARVAAGGIDLLILDLGLPVLSGLDVYCRLKELGKLVPTIVVTGRAHDDSLGGDVMRAVAASFLVKPFDAAHLLSAVTASRP